MSKLFSALVGLSLLASSMAAWSCCCLPIQPDKGRLEMQVPKQKALIFHDGDIEHLIVSIQYSGATDQFAWIIPVESKPQHCSNVSDAMMFFVAFSVPRCMSLRR